MSISATVRNYLEKSRTPYYLVPHSRSFTSLETAEAAHVAGDRLVKSVVVKGDSHYAIVLLPATHRISLGSLSASLGEAVDLAEEREIKAIFKDCELGSIPPFGDAYGVEVLVDDALLGLEEIYFEAGDHEELVHVSGEDFRDLMAKAKHGHFGQHL
jgi:Ala-tRNA(Pro) deacylase